VASRITAWVAEKTQSFRATAPTTPFRAELFNAEQLSQHAKHLASSHALTLGKGGHQLLTRLEENEAVLRSFNRSTLQVDQSRRITPAAEWLLDNFYLIEEQVQMAQRHFPKGYSRELPRLASGALAGYPRVYDLVLEVIAHTDAQLDAASLGGFVAAYQTKIALKLGELWAVPIMLRLGLIENLARVTRRLAIAREERNLADTWVDRLQDMAEKNPSQLVLTVADMARSDLPLTSSFVAEFCQRLSRQNPVLHLARGWLEQRLVEQGLSSEQLVHRESQNQAADQVSVSHSISSLRFLSAMDWKESVETLSHVDQTLRQDPAEVYADMDFSTRDRYRHLVETLARQSRRDEVEVAQLAVDLAKSVTQAEGREVRSAHVGYYLIDKGRAELERGLKPLQLSFSARRERLIQRFPLMFYVGGVTLITLLVTMGGVQLVQHHGVHGAPLLIFSAVFLLCASQLAVAVMNWLATCLVKPSQLPRMDYSTGIAPESRTMVAVPTLLSNAEGIDRLLELLEIHYLANRDDHLHFALLTDFRDASQENTPEDNELLERVREGIGKLAKRHRADRADIFFLFHRPRRWNASEGVWMGYERKRGKLSEFNAFLRGGAKNCFSCVIGETSLLPAIRYVITLDTDTQLPRDAARRLVGTLSHPLNRPTLDPVTGIISEGYGILQPRIGVSLPSSGRSWFVRVFAGDAGIDPYTRAISDVYQDIFQEGSFIGKGIYDVDTFEKVTEGRFPENTVLSHDLLESCHARSALVSDIELYEEYPSRYNVDSRRRHRWIRGDWQISQWLLPRVPGPDARRIANPLSGLSRWKIFDNLRRSLVPAALLLLILGGWFVLPETVGLILALSILLVTLPAVLPSLFSLSGKSASVPWIMHLQTVAGALTRQIFQIFFTFVFLPYDALISLDAIGRTWLRLLCTRRHLLEWQASSEAEYKTRSDLLSFTATMWTAPALAFGCGFYLVFEKPDLLAISFPLLALWAFAPVIAWGISQPIVPPAPGLSKEQLHFLHRIARKTWHFFETFVTAQENWLPPDNFQAHPGPLVASRTSPTNLGLALLANLAAHDFGYISTSRLLQRTQDALATMQRLERYRCHFFNWYDTRTLKPLQPLYISSVDSGNLAGHLLTCGAGLRELCDAPILPAQVFHGLLDTLRLLQDLAGAVAELSQLEVVLSTPAESLHAAFARLEQAAEIATQFAAKLASNSQAELIVWAKSLARECDEQRADLLHLAPWLTAFSHKDGAHEPGRMLTLRQLAALEPTALTPFSTGLSGLREGAAHARKRLGVIESLAQQCDTFARMDFAFLYDQRRHLFSIGYNVTDQRSDPSFYDLLASEARLCSYVAIALGQVPQEHWFSLGRLLVSSSGGPTLVSWSGSMFEYLMPQLVMPEYDNTLLGQSCAAAVAHQIEYGRSHGVPWGISESGYNRTDVHLNYQYRAFGVPGLGLKRGLAEDLVIAPYATVMALMVAPRASCENLQRLSAEGQEAEFGFYEAVDYTPSRLPPDAPQVTIQSFMAHHQGMSFLSLAFLLKDRPMQRRFMACPLLKATDLLLQERIPKTGVSDFSPGDELNEARLVANEDDAMRIFTDPSGPAPQVHLLSNGTYHVVMSSAGSGYSRWRELAVTRWREDATRDCWGTFIYFRDVATGELWSAAHQPTLRATKNYEAIFTQARAEFRQKHAGIEIHTEISVSPEDDVELRRVRLTNRSSSPRTIELTSYAEVVLAPPAADAAHPAFSNLFVQTEFIRNSDALLCTRRPRSALEKPPFLLHLLTNEGGELGPISYETDRNRFIGRGQSLVRPAALQGKFTLSNTVGSVLDPIVALRRAVTLLPGETSLFDFVLGMTETRDHALALLEKYRSPRMVERAFELAWTHSQVTLRHLNASEAEAQIYGRLSSALIYADATRRANPGVLINNRRGQNGLWAYGISGDAPLVLIRIGDAEKLEIVRQLIRAHSYWRTKGLTVELVILNQDPSVYRQSLHEKITSLIASGIEAQMLDKPGGIFVRHIEQMPNDDRVLLQSVARMVFDDANGTWSEQLAQRSINEPFVARLIPLRSPVAEPTRPLPPRDLLFFNGCGGFTRDGHEYVITLQPDQSTPAPWVNVLANPYFGTVISESGSAYSWAENAHEFRLTPWGNDPVQDLGGEAFYLRDEQTGQVWSPMPYPARGATPYVIRHGFGYSVFEHTEHGIFSEVWVYVAIDAPVKFTLLKLHNVSRRPRRLSVTGYCDWVLGDLRQKTLLHVQTEVDLATGALLARNSFNTEFPDRVAFVDINDPARTLTGDRREFLGRNGTYAQPAALKRQRLSGKTGAGLDPCGAVQVAIDLAPGEEREIHFRLGVARNSADLPGLIQRFRSPEASRNALKEVWAYWNRTLGTVNVDTPDSAVNVMANGWLLYQTISSRIFGRSGFYQSGGAYGFRDQLQDVMALTHAEPSLMREHLLRAAGQQFREGDVQHWWHPPSGRGVRTHFSDDFLWLPYVTCRYVNTVGDTGVLAEKIRFLEGRAVKADEEAYYDLPNRSEESATLYQHCVRAIERGLRFGPHGLPLMGCGDWNDGMNCVGHEGRGESVWLAFFLYDVLSQFSPLARQQGDAAFAARCDEQAAILQKNIELHAWDGQWYKRAYFDNGEPLGSKDNDECQIDSLPQSWSVLSGAGDLRRKRQAMQSFYQRLVKREQKLIQLFTPPFDHSALNPGYIKGYIPGVRENGGQYTHGAIWATMAFAALGENERAWELFDLLNPVNHGTTPLQIATYKVEPYVVAADIYALAPHTGRGGWTWYTGSAGWMYRLLIETLLGVHLEGDRLRLAPHFPARWTSYKVHYRYRQTVYHITFLRVGQAGGHAPWLTIDGRPSAEETIALVDDHQEHTIEARIR